MKYNQNPAATHAIMAITFIFLSHTIKNASPINATILSPQKYHTTSFEITDTFMALFA